MQEYVKIGFISRGIDPVFNVYPICEVCNKVRAVDLDHVDGRKKHLLLCCFNLIFVCRDCHTNKGGFRVKEEWKQIVLSKIKPGYNCQGHS